jgi:O-antigen/teichoic acid export membrane protein
VGILLVLVPALAIDGPATAWLVALAGLGTIAASLASSFLAERQATLALQSISARVAVAGLGGAVAGILMVWLTRSPVGAVGGMALGDGCLLALVWRLDAWKRPDWREAVGQIRHNRRLLVMQLSYIGQFRVGTIVLAAMGSAVAVAEYTIASRIAEGLVILAAALTASSLPLIGAAHARKEQAGLAAIFERSYRASLRIVAPLIAGIVIAAPAWTATFFPLYPGLGPPSAMVGLAVLIFFATSQTTALLNATHHDRAAVRSAVAGLVVSVIGSFGFGSFGAVGVAGARVVGELIRLLVEVTAAISELGMRPTSIARAWLVVSPALLGTAIVVVGHWQPLSVVVGGTLVLAGAMRLTRSGAH